MGARWIVGTTAAVSLAVVGALQLPLDAPFTSSVFGPLDLSSQPGAQFLGRSTAKLAATTAPPPGPRTPPLVTAEDDVPPSFGRSVRGDYAPGRVLVALRDGEEAAALARTNRELGASVVRRLPGTRVRQVRLSRGVGVEQAVRRYERDSAVEYAEPDWAVAPSGAPVVPNDPGFDRLFGQDNSGQTGGTPDADIDAPEAWATTVGRATTVVAVIDTGVDVAHPDLRDNIWTNPGEVPGNEVDDDRNGFVDDVHGWDFHNDDATVFDGAGDEHGTHVAGTIAATGGNGVGVTGVSWRARLMPLKFLGPDGTGYVSDAIAALDYAVDKGVLISNNSWGGASRSSALQDAIRRARDAGHLFVAAAGNGGGDGVGDNIDVTPDYPAAYPEDNVVSVAATDHTDTLARFSNYGPTGVDLAAPGVRILSTLPGNAYGYFSGTSMAAPHVSGAAALLLSDDPTLDASALRERLLSSVDAVGLASSTVTGGRLNIGTALAGEPAAAVSLTFSRPTVVVGATTEISGTVTVDGTPAAGRTVTVEQRPVATGTWTTVPGGESLSTTGEGTFSLTGVKPGSSTDYRARLADEPAESLVQRVNVRARVENATATHALSLGKRRVVTGSVVPAHDGSVQVTVLRNGTRVARRTVSLSGSLFRWSYRPKRAGGYTVVVTWVGDADHLGATSTRRSFRVRKG